MPWFQSLQADDLDAINRFISGATIRTPAAQALRDQWITWFDTRSSWEKQFDRVTFDEARNKRLDFQLANSLTDAEKAEVRRQASEGISSEQAQGAADRRQTGGTYSGKASSWGSGLALVGLSIVGSAVATAYVMRKLR